VRLDQLETLVGECGRVDGDLRAHVPGRVRKRIVRRNALQLLAPAPAERTARRGQHERVDLFRRTAVETLERSGVLAVDRKQCSPSASLCLERKLARGDEALLVGQGQVDAALERPERCGKTGESDDRVEDEVRLRTL